MFSFNKKLAGVASAALLVLGMTACNGAAKSQDAASAQGAEDEKAAYTLVEDGKLTVAAELGFAPFESMNPQSGAPEGFDVDIAGEIAKRLGLEVNYLPSQKFDTLVPMIKQGGKADIAIAGITINDERSQSIDFSDPYLDSNQSLVVKKDSDATAESLNVSGKKIVVQGGTTGEEWATENIPNATVVPLDDVAAALAGVQTGLYDGMVVDLPVASNLLSSSYTDLKIAQEIATGEQYGICISKDNPGLKDAVNKVLADMKSDGTMDKLQTKWFGATL